MNQVKFTLNYQKYGSNRKGAENIQMTSRWPMSMREPAGVCLIASIDLLTSSGMCSTPTVRPVSPTCHFLILQKINPTIPSPETDNLIHQLVHNRVQPSTTTAILENSVQ
jgi:hypothetical protein